MMRVAAWLLSGPVVRLLSMPRDLILPRRCWACGDPIPPMVLGILSGKVLDTSLRRALLTYSADPRRC